MSYAKKDEDAEQALLKVDRTAIYQEGAQGSIDPDGLLNKFSSFIQLVPYLSLKVSSALDQNRSASLHGREVSYE